MQRDAHALRLRASYVLMAIAWLAQITALSVYMWSLVGVLKSEEL